MTTIAGTAHRTRLYYGWVIVIVVALASFTQATGTFMALSVFLKPMTDEFGWSRTVFTGATTLGTIAGAFVSLVVGRYLDRLGGRWLLTMGLFLLGGAFVLMAFVQTLWQFYLLQLLDRVVTMGVIGLTLQVIVPKWFVVKRGRAVALAGLGGIVGSTVMPLYLQLAIDLSGWRLASAVAGISVWAVSILPVALFLRRQPEDMGLSPDGLSSEDAEREAQRQAVKRRRTVRQEVSWTLSQVLRFPSFYLLLASFSVLFLVGPGLVLHLIPYLQDKGIDPQQGVWILSIWAGAGAIGALVMGFLSERFGSRWMATLAFLLMGMGFAFLLMVDSLATGVAWALFMGSVAGAVFNTLYQLIFADYYGRESLGRIRGAVWPVQMLTNSAGPLIAAIAYDVLGTYSPVFVAFAGLMVLSAALVFMAKPPRSVPGDRTGAG
ncbi:MAG: MFS transporter [Chloroflexi bacterium]|nr:MFS transporter [Chloroflexota bacterium]